MTSNIGPFLFQNPDALKVDHRTFFIPTLLMQLSGNLLFWSHINGHFVLKFNPSQEVAKIILWDWIPLFWAWISTPLLENIIIWFWSAACPTFCYWGGKPPKCTPPPKKKKKKKIHVRITYMRQRAKRASASERYVNLQVSKCLLHQHNTLNAVPLYYTYGTYLLISIYGTYAINESTCILREKN